MDPSGATAVQDEFFQKRQIDGIVEFGSPAFGAARTFAESARQDGEGQVAFEKLASLVEATGSDEVGQTSGLEFERTGGLTGRRLVLRAKIFEGG
jgi:hypothetical protein